MTCDSADRYQGRQQPLRRVFPPAAHGLLRLLLLAAAAATSRGSKANLARHFAGRCGSALPRTASDAPRGTLVTPSGGGAVNDSYVWSAWAMAEPDWARASYTSYALGYPGNFGLVDWNGIAEYACQGALIVDKLLFMGGAAERALVRGWVLTMPVSASGAAWEAQNTQWHVASQGAWESSSEALIMLRLAVAHGAAPAFGVAPERLLCASRDGGATFALAGSGAAQPGLTAGACATAPAALLASLPLTGAAACDSAELLRDTPSAPFPGPGEGRDNGGRMLLQALVLPDGEVTHISLALAARASGATAWPASVALVEVSTGRVVAQGALPTGGAPTDAWTVLDVRDSGGAPPPAGLYVVVLASELVSASVRPQDSWFLGPSWATNACPAAGGGALQATYGASSLWLRNATADPAAPRLVAAPPLSQDAALALEMRHVASAAAAGAGSALGVSLAYVAARLLAHVLALSSLTPTAAAGRYDVFVIPDAMFRGSLEDGVNSGSSYYDLLRIGFASSYLSLRALEAVEAFAELQAAGLVPAACAPGSSAFGLDNARALDGDADPPCYSSAEVTTAAAALRIAIGARFSDAATGAFVDWFGCAALGTNGGDTTACRLADVAGGAPPPGSPLTAVATGFLPTLALAAKLGVPAGGLDVNATRRAFAAARDAARAQSFAGPGWFANSLRGLEDVSGGARTLIVQQDWRLTDGSGFAVHSSDNTGDWHLFSPAWVEGGGALGYGQYGAQAENGGRFFSTTAFVFDASGVYPGLLDDWLRAVRSLAAVGAQLEANDTSTPLLSTDPHFLSTPVHDATVYTLCARVRAGAGYPNRTDAWGAPFCNFYEDLPFALPENGAFLVAAARAFVGLRVRLGGVVEVNGAARAVVPGMVPWRADGALPEGWPGAARVEVVGVAVGAAAVNVTCDAFVAAAQLNCTVALAP
jgi:hypothetical protein